MRARPNNSFPKSLRIAALLLSLCGLAFASLTSGHAEENRASEKPPIREQQSAESATLPRAERMPVSDLGDALEKSDALDDTMTVVPGLTDIGGLSGSEASDSLVNGDFEQGTTGWTEYSSNGWAIILTSEDIPVRSGSWAAWLGGDNDETAYIEQTVAVPGFNPELSFYEWIYSDESCGLNFDVASVLVNGSAVDSYELCSDINTSGWVFRTVDLSGYAGQTIDLQIRVVTDGSVNSNLFVDDVSLTGSSSGSDFINGDFEQGEIGWTTFSQTGYTVIRDDFSPNSLVAHSGTWGAWLGGGNNELTSIEQIVSIAAGASTLRYYHAIGSADVCGYDFGRVVVNGSQVIAQYDLCQATNTGGWEARRVDLSAYVGQTVAVRIEAETDSSNNSNLFIDDVAMVSDSGSPVLGFGNLVIDDNNSGDSSGNDNDIAECGETLELGVGLHNSGSGIAQSVRATISTNSSYVAFPFNTASDYSSIAPGDVGYNSDDFDIEIDANTPDNQTITFAVQISAGNGGPWSDSFTLDIDCDSSQTAEPYFLPVAIHSRSPFYGGSSESEDNDTISTANGWLESGKTYSARPNDSNDYFSFYVSRNGLIRFRVNNHTGNGVQVILYNANTFPTAVCQEYDRPFDMSCGSTGTGIYYLRVFTESGHNNTEYQLRVDYPN